MTESVFVPSFNNKPLITAEDFYQAYCELSKLFHEIVAPTPDEVIVVNAEVIDVGFEDLLCEPTDQTGGGDIGLLACLVHEHRDAVRAEAEDGKGN
jgi:hypothetical protein